jgi:DNA polymerase-1
MAVAILDIETDCLDATVIHCLVIKEVGYDSPDKIVTFKEPTGVQNYLDVFDTLVAHNGIGFDFPILARLWGIKIRFDKMVDTLILSIMQDPARDGGHSLKSWGKRLGFEKLDYDGNFTSLTKEMLEYCEQDVRVCEKLYLTLEDSMSHFSQQSIRDEHRMRILADRISQKGFKLNKDKAILLYNGLMKEQDEISIECKSLFPDQVIERTSTKTGRRLKDKVVEFNPASRKQIGERLVELGWEPKVFTNTGLPKVDETTLGLCKLEVAQKLARYFLLQKRTSMIKSWLKYCSPDSRVHCQYRTLGAITNRMSCISPNLQQIPAVRVPYGKECREVWEADTDKVLIDTDAASLELRVLAHYMNDKKFTREVLEGDVHSSNQKMAGLETRDQAKTFIYALLYGAGDAKIGTVVGGSQRDGAELRRRFLANLPTYKRLSDAVQEKGRKVGKLKGIDGRLLRVRHAHASLNTLIQGSSAILMKKWFMFVDQSLRTKRLDASIVAMIHDELVLESCKKEVDNVRKSVIISISQVNQSYNLRCKLDCDVQIGNNWSEIH